jgi:hypothetical protein
MEREAKEINIWKYGRIHEGRNKIRQTREKLDMNR